MLAHSQPLKERARFLGRRSQIAHSLAERRARFWGRRPLTCSGTKQSNGPLGRSVHCEVEYLACQLLSSVFERISSDSRSRALHAVHAVRALCALGALSAPCALSMRISNFTTSSKNKAYKRPVGSGLNCYPCSTARDTDRHQRFPSTSRLPNVLQLAFDKCCRAVQSKERA